MYCYQNHGGSQDPHRVDLPAKRRRRRRRKREEKEKEKEKRNTII
jgi:hypothetical protein